MHFVRDAVGIYSQYIMQQTLLTVFHSVFSPLLPLILMQSCWKMGTI